MPVAHSLIWQLGVEKVDIDLEKQLVIVDASVPQEKVLETITKTGKAVTPIA
ncbi:hypothetical protein BC943DRAFT_325169 [Umbelopsis sp. AD052]|nr:hypothetical protein BC943DRAFT_325169 [Umbelopsis sp. AD052]